MVWKLFWLTILISTQSGCSKSDNTSTTTPDPTPASATTVPSSASPAAPSNLVTIVNTAPEPNHYLVTLRWPNAPGEGSWVIQRENRINGLEYLSTLDNDKREYIDNSVLPGEKYRYFLSLIGSSKSQESADATIPRDLVIDGTLRLHTIKNVNRLFFLPSSKIITSGGAFTVSVGEIISQGGTIQTFDTNELAADGQKGKDGGLISIEAATGTGKLKLNISGQNGGTGLKGPPGKPGYPGLPGANATIEARRLINGDDGSGNATLSYIYHLGVINASYQLVNAIQTRYFCIGEGAEDGVAGSPGTAGGAGGPGHDGGNSSKVFVRILKSSTLDLSLEGGPGAGGKGGEGGDGGPGGPGGASGKNDPHGACKRVALVGKPGPSGNSGPVGSQGLEGKRQPVCLKLGTGVIGDCSAFSSDLDASLAQ